jgi:eukaryotic-like serine/threonine-protein kinase
LSGELQISHLLDRRFEITGRIEHSGMATVFRALDRETGRIVAIKVPRTDVVASAAIYARIAHEAAVLAKLNHRGIAKVFPVPQKSRPYLVMEYIEGQTLHDVLDSRGRLPLQESFQLASRLCEILEYLHRRGIVHRDLKPANIIISDDGFPHLIDFGLAKEMRWPMFGFGFMAETAGTLEYMAPEQMQGDRVDARADIYSLGAILHKMLTGIRPEADVALVGSLRALIPSISEQAEEIVLHALAPHAAARYSSAAAMKCELDFPETVCVTGTYRNPAKPNVWPRRLSMACLLLGLAAMPVILFYIFFLIFQRQLSR